MKRILFLLFFVAAVLGVNAQDKKVTIKSAAASSSQSGNEAKYAIDGSSTSIWHTNWTGGTSFPVTFTVTLDQVTHVDYLRYIPRQDGNSNGNWNEVDLSMLQQPAATALPRSLHIILVVRVQPMTSISPMVDWSAERCVSQSRAVPMAMLRHLRLRLIRLTIQEVRSLHSILKMTCLQFSNRL